MDGHHTLQRRYVLKPLKIFKVIPKVKGFNELRPRSGHRIVASESHIYSFGGYNPYILIDYEVLADEDWIQPSPLFNELWKFNIASKVWTKLQTSGENPDELASNCAVLKNNQLLIFGGTGIPFGQQSSNKLSVCNLKTLKWKLLKTSGSLPNERYGQAMVALENYIYVIGGTSGYEYSMDVHELDLFTKEWIKLESRNHPNDRYRHEVALFNGSIYVFGGGTASNCFGFEEISCFNISLCSWLNQPFQPDSSVPEGYPAARRCHSFIQIEHEAYVIGGYDGRNVFSDIWKADLEAKKWTKLSAQLPCPVYFHSAALSPTGKVYIFGGVTDIETNTRTNETYEMWLKIPKLKEACWEAILSYLPHINHFSKEYLQEIGIPLNFLERIDNFEDEIPQP